MAEIKIEKKQTIWPWILLALLAIAAIFYFVSQNDDETDTLETTEEVIVVEDEDNMDAALVANYDSAIEKYSMYIGNDGKMGIDHEYSNDALNYLIDAVIAKAAVLDVDIAVDLDKAEENAEKITKNPYKVTHANLIKNSGMIITNALATIQNSKYPNLSNELSEVKTAVSSIKTKTETLEQKETVKSFFRAAEALLIKMN
jgi:hypothetical protein